MGIVEMKMWPSCDLKKCILALQRVSLKNKDIITTPNYFEIRTIRTAQPFPVMFGK